MVIDERKFINDFVYNKFYLQELNMKCNNRKISILRIAHARVSYCTAVLPTWTVIEGQRPTTTALNRRFGEPMLCRRAEKFYIPGQHEGAASGKPWVDKHFEIQGVSVRPLAAVRTEGDGCPGDLVVSAVPALTVAHEIQRVMLRGSQCLLLPSS